MSNEIITCFNGGECTYKECPMFSEEIDMCKLEYLKGTSTPTTPQEPTQEPEPTTQPGGARLINTLKEGEKGSKATPLNIKGTLVFDPTQRDFDRKDGSTGTVTNITLKDGSGECKMTFWDKTGNEIMDFKKGDKLFFEGLYKVDSPWDGKPQIDAGKYFKVVKVN